MVFTLAIRWRSGVVEKKSEDVPVVSEGLNLEKGLYVFPNPATTHFYFQVNLPYETEVGVSIFDLSGTLVQSENKGVYASGKLVEKVQLYNLSSWDLHCGSGIWRYSALQEDNCRVMFT